MDRAILKNEEFKYFSYLDAGVEAYKSLIYDENSSFYNSVKKNSKAPALNNIPGSDVLLSKTLLALSLAQRLLVFSIRERKDDLLFVKMQSDSQYVDMMNEMFSDEPNLTQAEAEKILTQFCNAIAHGDVVQMFDFEHYKKEITEIYRQCGTLSPKNPDLQNKLADALEKCACLVFNYESNFTFTETGEKIRRPATVKKQLKLTFDHLKTVTTYLAAEDFIQNRRLAFEMNKGKYYLNDRGVRKELVLDDIQEEELNLFTAFYNKLMKEYGLGVIDQIREVYDKEPDLLHSREQHDGKYLSPTLLENVMMVGLQHVLFEKELQYLKIRNLTPVALALPANLDFAKYSADGVVQRALQLNFMNFQRTTTTYDCLNLVRSTCANGDLFNVYKEFLITETMSMFEILEQKGKIRELASAEIFHTLAKDLFEVEEATDDQAKTVIKHLRNSFMHGRYISSVTDSFYIYDQVSKRNEDVEYKFELYLNELEKIKDACLDRVKTIELPIDTAEVSDDKDKSTEKTKE